MAAKPQDEIRETTILLFDELRAPLLRYLLSLRLSLPDGEEIVQEVFLALYQHLRKGKPETNLRAWTFTVAHNLALKRRVRMQRIAPESKHETIDESPGPEELVADAERRTHLRAVVRALPELDRCCLALRAEGVPYREIASILKISLGSVAASLDRSLGKLMRADVKRETNLLRSC
jgi:RNA polymerase sigma-70 factor (ECF subfamily)